VAAVFSGSNGAAHGGWAVHPTDDSG